MDNIRVGHGGGGEERRQVEVVPPLYYYPPYGDLYCTVGQDNYNPPHHPHPHPLLTHHSDGDGASTHGVVESLSDDPFVSGGNLENP